MDDWKASSVMIGGTCKGLETSPPSFYGHWLGEIYKEVNHGHRRRGKWGRGLGTLLRSTGGRERDDCRLPPSPPTHLDKLIRSEFNAAYQIALMMCVRVM